MTLSRSNCDLCDLFMNQMLFTIVNNTICPNRYLNLGPLDLQSNTLPLCHGGCWHLVLITLVGLFNDSFAISRTAYLLFLLSYLFLKYFLERDDWRFDISYILLSLRIVELLFLFLCGYELLKYFLE